jgi:hypothetical protein
VVYPLWPEPDERDIPQPEPASLRLFHQYSEPFTSPNAFHSFVVHLPPEFPQQSSDPSVPIPTEPGCKVDDVARQGFFIVSGSWDMALGGSRLSECTAGPSFRDFWVKLLDTPYALATTRRA